MWLRWLCVRKMQIGYQIPVLILFAPPHQQCLHNMWTTVSLRHAIIHDLYPCILLLLLCSGELLSTDVIIAVVSSTSVFIISLCSITIFIFICGFLCGRHFSKKPTTSQSREEELTEGIQLGPSSPSGPVYENIASEAIEHCDNDESNVDLNTNVSYGPLSIFTK